MVDCATYSETTVQMPPLCMTSFFGNASPSSVATDRVYMWLK